MSLSYTDLKKGLLIVYQGDPYEVIEANFLRMQQRKAVVQTKIRNLITGKVLDRNWQPSDQVEEAEVKKEPAMFIYGHRGEFWFHGEGNPKDRFSLPGDILGNAGQFLKGNTPVTAVWFGEKVIKVMLPVKIDLEVTEAPPAIRGNTAQGGTKQVTLEEGATTNVPLFINQGDIVRVNTETGEYVERVEKG